MIRIQIYVDKKGEEWLISASSIRNSRESKEQIEFPDDLKIRDVVKMNGSFYILTDKSVMVVEAN